MQATSSGVFGARPIGTSKYFCSEAEGFLNGFAACVEELVVLHEQQFVAITQGDPALEKIDELINEANAKKQKAKYLYLRHLEQHGCSHDDAISNH